MKLIFPAFLFVIVLLFPSTPSLAAERIAGENRYSTAVMISQKGWQTAQTVILAKGSDFPDALAGGPLAFKENSPILLTQSEILTQLTKNEISRLKARKVIILGGEVSISNNVENTLKGMGLEVERVAGQNRYETALLIAQRLGSDKAILANGENFPDALSISPYAAMKGIPILLTQSQQVNPDINEFLSQKNQVIIVGGNQVISKSIDSILKNANRFEGSNRYDTSANIINKLIESKGIAYISTGENFADALTGSVLAAKQGAPIILTGSNSVPSSIKALLPKYEQKKIIGGLISVGYKVENIISPLKSRILLNAPLISQMPELPRGCEVTSLSMLLNFAGKPVDKMKLAREVKTIPWESGGFRGHPNDGFVGNMYTFSKSGCCVFHSPIANIANKYLPGRIVDLTGEDFEAVMYYLNQGKPVWVINTSWFKPVPGYYWSTWKTKHGNIQMTKKEHSVLITGYDNQYIYFNDPLANIKNRAFSKTQFIAGWQQFGKQAITFN
jgi:uncharacterized protein YvpB/putative cell wall-binding protein